MAHQFESELCPHCMKANSPGQDFCNWCGAPLSTHATTDPLLGIRAEGFAFQTAAGRPRKPIVLVGVWLLFGSLCLFFALLFIGLGISLVQDRQGPLLLGLLGELLLLGFTALFGAIVYRTTKNYFRQRQQEESSASE